MTTLLIILGIIGGIIVLSFISHLVKLQSRKSEFKDWKVGDLLILKSTSDEFYEIKKEGKSMVRVLGWTQYNLYLEIDGSTRQCSWDCFKDNKSAVWRRNYENCKSTMGVEPGFEPSVTDSSSTSFSGQKIDGKPIETMSETECQVYLKKAIEEEDYRTAELIRKRLENFR
jgi:hypothetical protein